MGSRRRIVVSVLIVAVSAATLTVAAAATRQPHASRRPLSRAAVTPPVKILAKKSAIQTATVNGAVKNLITAQGISTRAQCSDLGNGSVELDIQMKTGAFNAIVVSPVGGKDLTTQFATVFSVIGSAVNGFDETYDIRIANGSMQRYDVSFVLHFAGKDCLTRLVRYSA
jgi:hypothetical protein